MPKETGIIMSGSHPVDILEGRKTMTRRLWGLKEINEHPDAWEHFGYDQSGRFSFRWIGGDRIQNVKCPYGGVGDFLRVKETWAEPFNRTTDKESEIPLYKADIDPGFLKCYDWKPSIFMPRWASRITCEITEIRAERLQEITPQDIEAEGIKQLHYTTGICLVSLPQFKMLWDSLNAKKGYEWDKNPWVWCLSFRRSAILKEVPDEVN